MRKPRGGRGRRAGHPRDRSGLLRLEHGQELEHQYACSTSSARIRRQCTRVRKLDPATARGAILRRVRPGFRAGEGARRRRRDFQPIPLKATLSANLQAQVTTITSHNVVGLLPGKKHPDETVIYSCALGSSRDRQARRQWRHIYNGAVDNGTGIAPLIEQARAFVARAAPRPFGRVPGCHRRREGPARLRILRDPPALPAGQDGRRPQHRRHERLGPGEEFQHLVARPSSTCSTTSSRRASGRAAISRPTRTLKPAASIAPTISRSPSGRAGGQLFDRATIW